jgi:hypothetical protein
MGWSRDFGALDTQHDAAQAYIRSQAAAGWPLFGPCDKPGHMRR